MVKCFAYFAMNHPVLNSYLNCYHKSIQVGITNSHVTSPMCNEIVNQTNWPDLSFIPCHVFEIQQSGFQEEFKEIKAYSLE